MRIRLILILMAAAWIGVVNAPAEADIRMCGYNLLQFGTSSVSGDQVRIDAFKLVLSQIDPDILMVQEISNDAAVSLLVNQILNAPGGPGGIVGSPEHYTAATFTDTGSGLDQALIFRDALFQEQAADYVILNTTPRNTPRWRMRPLVDSSGDSDLYVYSMHLSAGDSASRATQTGTVRANANMLPADSNIIYVGDFNISSSNETSYQNLIGSQADNDGRGFDPINRPGSWGNSAGFADIHTQSTHQNNGGAPGGAAAGGLDDRFDFQLISNALLDGIGIDYISSTYRAFGNDGNHFNNDINDNPVIPEGAAVADALHAASDHLPVILDLSDPISVPQIALTPPSLLSFPLAIVGGTSTAQLTVTNTSPIPAEDLEYSFGPSTSFMVPMGNFVEPAGGGGIQHLISMDTSVSANNIEFVDINNNSENGSPSVTIILSGAVLDHAVPSTTPSNQNVNGSIEFSTPGGAMVDETARVHNADFSPALSAQLSVTAAVVLNDASGRFSTVGFVPVGAITDFADFTVRFDGIGAAPGTYTADLVFSNEDDSALSGASTLADVTFALSATIPGPVLGDFNQSGVVESGDVPGMVALLLDPQAASVEDQATGDMNQDAINDALDLQPFIDAMLP